MSNDGTASFPLARGDGEVTAYAETFYQLATEASATVQDPTFDASAAMKQMNRGLKEICARLATMNTYLPSLAKEGEVVAYPDAEFCRLPADWFGNLREVFDVTVGIPIRIVDWEMMRHMRTTRLPGRLHSASVNAGKLYYWHAPDNEHVLRLSYICQAPSLNPTDRVTSLPPEVSPEILLNYAAWRGYSLVEQEDNGQRPNTAYHKGEFEDSLIRLVQEIGPWPLYPVEPNDAARWGEVW